MLSVFF